MCSWRVLIDPSVFYDPWDLSKEPRSFGCFSRDALFQLVFDAQSFNYSQSDIFEYYARNRTSKHRLKNSQASLFPNFESEFQAGFRCPSAQQSNNLTTRYTKLNRYGHVSLAFVLESSARKLWASERFVLTVRREKSAKIADTAIDQEVSSATSIAGRQGNWHKSQGRCPWREGNTCSHTEHRS